MTNDGKILVFFMWLLLMSFAFYMVQTQVATPLTYVICGFATLIMLGVVND